MRYNRLEKIKQILRTENTISVERLAQTLEVSINTIRRDIATLESEGFISKFYGGIKLATPNEPTPFSERESINAKAKVYVAQKAASFIKNRDVIFIDSGTTTMYLPEFLAQKNVTILTCSLLVMNTAVNLGLNLIGTGGTLFIPSKSFVGGDTLTALKKYNITKAFMSSSGVSLENGVTNASPLETEIKQFIMATGAEKNLLIDSSKFGKSALMSYADLKDFDNIFTDKRPAESFCDYFKNNGVKLIY